MQTAQHFNPSFGMLEINLEPGEKVHAESGAMVGKDTTVRLETKARGGIFSSLKRSVLGGESFFQNTFSCDGKPGTLFLAPGCDGSVVEHDLNDEHLYIQSGSYLANTGDVTIDAKLGGAKTFFF